MQQTRAVNMKKYAHESKWGISYRFGLIWGRPTWRSLYHSILTCNWSNLRDKLDWEKSGARRRAHYLLSCAVRLVTDFTKAKQETDLLLRQMIIFENAQLLWLSCLSFLSSFLLWSQFDGMSGALTSVISMSCTQAKISATFSSLSTESRESPICLSLRLPRRLNSPSSCFAETKGIKISEGNFFVISVT